MEKIGNVSLIITFLALITFLSQKACAQEPENAGHEASLSYADPSKWGELDPKYKLCSTGSKQSPIDIDMGKIKITDFVPYNVTYNVNSANVVATGLDVHLAVRGQNELTIDQRTYTLVNILWHTPSEHVFSGKPFDLEMQQVFKANDNTGNVAIIASFYNGAPNGAPRALLTPLEDEMNVLTKEFDPNGKEVKSKDIDPTKLYQINLGLRAPFPKDYFRYIGSLTTPPCTEEVTWILIPGALPVLNDQLDSIRALLSTENKKNARPIQNLNGREVLYVSKNAPA